MKKICLIILIFVGILLFSSPVYAQSSPHLELSPSSGMITASGTSIEVNIDTGAQAAKSAKSVINFDSSLLEVTSVQTGDFFDDVSHNIYNSSGQVIINANLSIDSMLESKTGIGTLGTMTVKAKDSSGTAAMTFDCIEGSSTDSNINDPTPLDIIVCSANVNGSYSLSAGTATASSSPTTIGIGGETTSTSAAIPVTGSSIPTILFLTIGGFLIFTPLLSKIKING